MPERAIFKIIRILFRYADNRSELCRKNMEQQKRYTNALLEKIIAYILNNPVKAGI